MNIVIILVAVIGASLGVILGCVITLHVITKKILEDMEKEIEELRQKIGQRRPLTPISSQPPFPKKRATHQDLSKFFKGKGKLASWYRKTIKRKVSPEEES